MPPPERKPLVVHGTPSRGEIQVQMSRNLHFATLGGCRIVDPYSGGSLLGRMFNNLWCNALNLREAGAADYFLLNHADVEVRTPGWLDLMIAEMRKVGAAILSGVVCMKTPGDLPAGQRETSTAMHIPGTWRTRKLSLAECWQLPKTFCADDVRAAWPRMGSTNLVVNSGLLLVDLSRPEFLRADEDGELEFFFTVQDRCSRDAEGRWKADSWSEDWDFSDRCNAAGLPVYATTVIDVIHHGGGQWSNQPPEKTAA